MNSISVSHDLRNRFGPARDQGGRETCLAFAASDAHAAAIGTPWSPLCCEYLFYHAKHRDKTPAHHGTTIASIRSALEHDGQPVETEWPYLSELPENLTSWKPPATIGTLFYRKSQSNKAVFDDIWDAIQADVPTLVGMTLSGTFFLPDNDGVIDADEPPETTMRHAVLAVATGVQASRRLLLVRNSWGSTWGMSGYAWVSERYLTPRILAAITVN